jgi:cyclophilin family peptidyl-prolyl cis-trans isomerase
LKIRKKMNRQGAKTPRFSLWSWRLGALAVQLPALCLGCRSPEGAPAPASSQSAAPVAVVAPSSLRVDDILAAEVRRNAPAVTAAEQQSRDVEVRRAAARALARIGGEPAQAGLLRALADEDAEVAAWGAYGLGFFCKGHEKASVAALVARFLDGAPAASATPARLDRQAAIARAVGRCGAEESEPTLVAWLAGPPAQAVAAAFALGDLGSARAKLREETFAALLNVAAGSAAAPPLPEALFPVGRMEHVPLTVVDRIREVASARLATPGEARVFAVRALGRGGEAAAPELLRVLTSPATFTATERAEAARSLKRLGKPGQRALASALPSLVPASDPVALTGLVGDELGVILTTLESITDAGPAKKALAEVAALPSPPGAPGAVTRRVALLRCGAAKLLAGSDVNAKLLTGCDPEGSGAGARALVEVLGRDSIVGARLALYRELVGKGDLRAREAALELLEAHEEIVGAADILTEALLAKEGGLVATAAEVLSKQPSRAGVEAPAAPTRRPRKKKKAEPAAPVEAGARPPAPALVKALLDALARPATLEDPEIADSVIDAVGALTLKDGKARLDELCRSPYPTTREHAAKAIGLVSAEKKTCEAPAPDAVPAPAELGHLVRAPAVLSLDTDAGALTLTLDPALAPVVVTRVVDLARAGYYDGIVVHRVVTGFVAQFGAPHGDGFGGPPGQPALRCETSPLPFATLAVGVALAGRDTGSSQLFVMQGRAPHLDGGYAIIGAAAGPWTSLAEGDVIRKVKVAP